MRMHTNRIFSSLSKLLKENSLCHLPNFDARLFPKNKISKRLLLLENKIDQYIDSSTLLFAC